MGIKEVQQRIEKLKKEINHHRYLYHVLDKQEISDAALDSLKHELDQLEKENPELITLDSPTQRVSGQAMDKFTKVAHQTRMVSLTDAFSFSEIEDWEKRNKKLLTSSEKLDYYAELKMDGLAMSLIYKDGKLVKGVTRGDGKIGEDVTSNIRTIEAIPLILNNNKLKLNIPSEVEVRGEVYMLKSVFDKLNKEQESNNQSKFANPRNAAAGSIRQLDSKIAASRELSFMAYDLVTDFSQKTHQESHELLEKIGFRSGMIHNKHCNNVNEVQKHFEDIGKLRNGLKFWTDGVVVNINNIETYKKLGIVGKAPRGSIAYKYPAEQATTIVEDIQVQVGRTGALTPVAHLKPVQVAGSTVARATLHNIDEIERLGVRIGDTVIIQKAGDIIPDVVEVLPKLRTGKEKKYKMPTHCPVCNAKVNRKEGEVAYYCDNKDCYALQHQSMKHFISKKAFDIDGLGPRVLDQLFKADLIKTPADLFDLKIEDLQPLERFADKSAENLVESIKDAKKISLAKFIYALGIRHVGEETAITLSQEYKTFGKIINIPLKKLEALNDIGGVVAKSINEYFQNKANIDLVNKLLNKVTIIKEVKKILSDLNTKLVDKKIVVTGILESMSRDEAKEQIRRAGGKWVSSVSKNTDFVVAGDKPGSKVDKAKKLGINVISEEEFKKLFNPK
ncbi:MAG: NAD-dependent DNA ligase LigA [Candidatus Kerfeldbacteria bacterium]